MRIICCLLLVSAALKVVAASVSLPVIPSDGWQKMAEELGVPEIFRLKDQKIQGSTVDILSDSVHIQWNQIAGSYLQAYLIRPVPLPEFDEAVFHLTAKLPVGALHHFNLRLIDRDGEIFHFSKAVTVKEAKSQRYSYRIVPEKPAAESWAGGKKANGKLDFPVRFLGFSAGFQKRDGRYALTLYKADLEIRRGKAPLELTFHTGLPIPVIRPGYEKEAKLRFRNCRPESVSGKISWQICDLEGRECATGVCGNEVPPGETTVQIELPTLPYGVYFLTVLQENTPLQTFRYAVMHPAGPTSERASGFLFGVVDHPLSYSWRDQQLEAAAAALCGVKIFRFNPLWHVVEPRRGQREYAKIDRLYDLFGKYGIEFQVLFSGTPKWAVGADWKKLTEGKNPRGSWAARPDYDAYAAHVREFAARYKGRSRYYEIWNEADLPQFADFTVDEYLELLRRGSAAIKSADPEAIVMTTGFATTTTNFRAPKQGILERVLAERGAYDVIAFHGHGALSTYNSRLDTLFRLRKEAHSEAPWYANETAISSAVTGETGQAVVLFQKFLTTWARGGIGFNWYNLRNKGGEGFKDSEYENAFGLVTKDYEPKAAYVAYNALAGLYRNGTFLQNWSNGNLTGYLFRGRDGSQLFAHWNGNELCPESLWLFSGITGTPSLVDLYGNETQLVAESGLLPLRVSKSPATLKVDGQMDELAIGTELLRQANPFSVMSGERGDLCFTVENPLSIPLLLNLRLQLSEQLACNRPSQQLRLGPRECRKIVFSVNAATEFRSYAARPETLALTVAGKNWRETLSFPVLSNVRIPVGAFPEQPQFRLGNQEQVVSFAISGPENHLLWSGPDDLSAEIWLAGDQDILRLKIAVTDDIHYQPYCGSRVWLGDNVQFALQLPGQNTFWEFGLTRRADGDGEVFCWQAPRGFAASSAAAAIRLRTSRDEIAHRTFYEAELPRTVLGLSEKVGRDGFRFNLLVNDNDGEKRESCLSVAPGIERDKNPAKFPFVSFR